MKYKFQEKAYLTYNDKDIEVETDLSNEEVATIKDLVADYEPDASLLQILQDGAPDLFKNFRTVIYKSVLVELLIVGMHNYRSEIRHDEAPVNNPENYRKTPIVKLYDMYHDYIDIEHSNSITTGFL